MDGAVLEGGPPPGCDLAKEPKDSAPCVTELVGVFVSPLGDDTADGSRNKPVKTVGRGLELLADRGRVYICEGTYAEAVTLTKTVSLYGGWSCAGGTWAYTGKKPIVRSAAGSVAITLKSAKDVVVTDIAFEASDATAKGGSSIAGFAANSSARLVRDSFTAGVGQPGEDGPATVAGFSPATAATGNAGTTSAGNRLANPLCPTTAGGFGGGPTSGGATGATGEPLLSPSVPLSATGLGGTSADCTGSTGGRAGSHGVAGVQGSGAGVSGLLSAAGWQVEAGKSGGPGGVGQGGGGGGSTETTYGGGGGAPGGCGGAFGIGGGGGGASVGFVSFASTISMDANGVTSAQPGKGGNGGAGQIGQAGNFGGSTQSGAACQGGKGGAGGGGGGGGGGAGGLSVGILWSGTAPTFDGTPVQNTSKPAGITVAATAAAGGTKGNGGAAAVAGSLAGLDGTDGKAGVSQATLGL